MLSGEDELSVGFKRSANDLFTYVILPTSSNATIFSLIIFRTASKYSGLVINSQILLMIRGFKSFWNAVLSDVSFVVLTF